MARLKVQSVNQEQAERCFQKIPSQHLMVDDQFHYWVLIRLLRLQIAEALIVIDARHRWSRMLLDNRYWISAKLCGGLSPRFSERQLFSGGQPSGRKFCVKREARKTKLRSCPLPWGTITCKCSCYVQFKHIDGCSLAFSLSLSLRYDVMLNEISSAQTMRWMQNILPGPWITATTAWCENGAIISQANSEDNGSRNMMMRVSAMMITHSLIPLILPHQNRHLMKKIGER